MKIKEIKVENFRKHRKGNINFGEKELSILVGNNNSGKSTYINAIKKIVTNKNFLVYDFYEGNKTFLKFFNLIKESSSIEIENISFPFISIEITFKVNQNDREIYGEKMLALADFISNDNEIIYKFTYSANKSKLGLYNYIQNTDESFNNDIIEHILSNYYQLNVEIGNCDEMIAATNKDLKINEIIHLKVLEANLLIDQDIKPERNSKIGNSLLNVLRNTISKNPTTISDIQNAFNNASNEVKETYKADLEISLINIFKNFGYKSEQSGQLKIDLNILAENTLERSFNTYLTLGNSEELFDLPDSYNGLGYNNLLLTLVEIYNFVTEIENNDKPINLICIEEPETHMHPELERKFIERISELKKIYLDLFENTNLIKTKIDNCLQIIITTHSPNIVSNSKYDDLIFVKDSQGISSAELNQDDKFAIQHLTIEKTEALFSKKIILVEGDVERILIPYFIRKKELNNELYSVVQIDGTHFQKFQNFYEKIGAKILIITDLDLKDRTNDNSDTRVDVEWRSSKRDVNGDCYNETSNNFLLDYYQNCYSRNDLKIMEIASGLNGINGNTNVVTQLIISEDEDFVTVGRTFEEQFILENSILICEEVDAFKSLCNYSYFNATDRTDITTEIIINNAHGIYRHIERNNNKTKFAFDLIKFIDNDSFKIPKYIEEGLLWLLTD